MDNKWIEITEMKDEFPVYMHKKTGQRKVVKPATENGSNMNTRFIDDIYVGLTEAKLDGDAEKVSKIEAQLYSAITIQAHRICMSKAPQDADDLAQQVALRVWRRLHKYNPQRASFKLFVRLNSEAVLNEHLAKSYRRIKTDEYNPEIHDLFENSGEPVFDYEQMAACFGEDIQLLDLILSGCSFPEAEALMGLTRKAIRNKIKKAAKQATGAISQKPAGIHL